MRFINDSLHRALNYIVAVVLIVTPFLAGFAEHSQAALGLSVAAGVALFLYSLLTDPRVEPIVAPSRIRA